MSKRQPEKENALPRGIKVLIWAVSAAVVCGLAFILTVQLLYRNVHRSIVTELGMGLPEAGAFLTDDREASYRNPPEVSLTEEGIYELSLQTGIFRRHVTLFVADTLAPEATGHDAIVTVSETLTPMELLDSCSDASAFTVEWKTCPEFGTVGIYETAITVTDAYSHVTEVPVTVTVVAPCAAITVEAGSTLPVPSDFLVTAGNEGAFFASELPDPSVPGEYPVTVSYFGNLYGALLTVEDTVAPEAELQPCETYTGYPLTIEDFIVSCSDVTEVTYRYLQEPDWSGDGEQPITIAFTDTSGNETVLETVCTLTKEYEAPKLWGVANRTCYVGESVSYFSNVYAEDNFDAPDCIEITVDKSQVNPRETGSYPVTYTATDRSGNSVSQTVTFTFREPSVSEEELNELVDEILAEILTEDMTPTEQAWAIFVYVYDHIYYDDNNSNFTDWQLAAYKGFTTGRGDCYTYYACSYVLLNRIDCQVISIRREENSYKRHFWCLVNLGTGWYHFDPTNFNTDKIPPRWAFMRTTKELYNMRSGTYFWSYKESKYPPTATTPFVWPEN